jgi:hypothetical protein
MRGFDATAMQARASPSDNHLVSVHDEEMPRSDLPGGTVTFLFTDVEGSTRLLAELGAAAYADAFEASSASPPPATARMRPGVIVDLYPGEAARAGALADVS